MFVVVINLLVQIYGPIWVSLDGSGFVLDLEDVIALDKIKGNVEHADHEFEIGSGQISAGYDNINIPKALPNVTAVNGWDFNVAQPKDLHESSPIATATAAASSPSWVMDTLQ